MSGKNNATCSICGKPYHMCISCKDSMAATPWKRHTCSSEHFKVYQVIHGYSTKVYTKKEAKERFQRIDLSDLDTFRDSIKATVKDIMSVNKTRAAVSNNVVGGKHDAVIPEKAEVKHVNDDVVRDDNAHDTDEQSA